MKGNPERHIHESTHTRTHRLLSPQVGMTVTCLSGDSLQCLTIVKFVHGGMRSFDSLSNLIIPLIS